jgi:hypothetical protein
MDAKLADPKPLIYVCDRHGFIEEMTGYLYSNNLKKYIEVYALKVSPQKTPQVVGKLLDLDCNEDFVRQLLQNVGIACPVEELVEQVRSRESGRGLSQGPSPAGCDALLLKADQNEMRSIMFPVSLSRPTYCTSTDVRVADGIVMQTALVVCSKVERRNRLRILQPWLEALVATGNTEMATHNAIGKIYITLNRDPVNFLKNNQFYDPKGTRPVPVARALV